jgi:hypothetical protein
VWTARTEALLEVLDDAEDEAGPGGVLGPDVAGWVGEQRLRQPLRARQWARERARWEAVRGELAPAALLAWMRRLPTSP